MYYTLLYEKGLSGTAKTAAAVGDPATPHRTRGALSIQRLWSSAPYSTDIMMLDISAELLWMFRLITVYMGNSFSDKQCDYIHIVAIV